MAEKLAEAEKDRDKSKKKFDATQDLLEKVVRKWLAEKDGEKQLDLLQHMVRLLREAVKAGEDYVEANQDFDKAAKASGKK
jgi:hypothetical protein